MLHDDDRENLDHLFRLMDQLCAATALASAEEFLRWNDKIRQDYLCLVDDLAGNARRIVNDLHL
jgi:hypothetical protein